jgi:hypothetical protein
MRHTKNLGFLQWQSHCLNLLATNQHVNASSFERPDPMTQQLLDYWIQHPEAQSTVEAIVEWWLLEQRIQKAAEEVRPLLAELVAKEFVLERRQADGRICYRLNRDKEAEVRAWLKR